MNNVKLIIVNIEGDINKIWFEDRDCGDITELLSRFAVPYGMRERVVSLWLENGKGLAWFDPFFRIVVEEVCTLKNEKGLVYEVECKDTKLVEGIVNKLADMHGFVVIVYVRVGNTTIVDIYRVIG
jgi:hypothetical protein